MSREGARIAITGDAARTDALLQDAPCGFISARPDGTITWVNNTFLVWIGLDRNALLSGCRFQDLLTTPGQVYYQTHIAPLLRMQGAVNEISCQLARTGRPSLPALVNFAMKADADGNPDAMLITVFDATDRTKYERELRLARNQAEQFSAIVKSAPDAIISVGPDLDIRTWNAGATSVFGYGDAEAIGRSIVDLIVPADRRAEWAGIQDRVAAAQEPVRAESLLRRKDSSIVPMEINASPLFDADGEIVGAAFILRDITERLQTASRLQGSEARYRSVVEGSPHGIVIQQSGRIVYANPAMARMFGYAEPARMIGLSTFEDLISDESLPMLRARTAAVYRGEHVDPHPGWRGKRKDGRLIWVSSTAHISEWQGEPAVTSFYSDITRQKSAEMAVRESEAKLQLAVAIARLGLGAIDYLAGTITLDPVAAAIFGLSAGVPLPRAEVHLRFHPDCAREVREKIALALDPDRDGFMSVDHRIVRPDGSMRWVSARKQVQFAVDAQGVRHAVGGLLIVRDITDEKVADAELRASRLAYRQALKAARSGAWEWDIARDRVTWSPEIGELIGVEARDYPRTLAEFLRFVPEEERDAMAAGIRSRLDTGSDSYDIENRLQRGDGTFRWVRGTGRIERDAAGVPLRVVGLVSDIHELRKAQEGVKASEARLRRILDNVLVLVSTLTPDGILTEANAMAMSAHHRADVVGKPFWECFWWSHAPEVQQRMREAVARAAAGEVVRCDVDARLADDQLITVDFQLAPIVGEGGDVIELVSSAVDVTERRRAAEQITNLMNELNHRSKNLLSVVMAVARQTARRSAPAEFVERLSDRIAGLSASQDLMIKNRWQGVELQDLVEAQLAHFRDLFGTRVLVGGPRLRLSASAAQGIGMALHELATNAAKYGALSNLQGRVVVAWEFVDPKRSEFRMSWLEEGGPPVAVPTHGGFGQVVIRQMVEAAVRASVTIEYRETGLAWTLSGSVDGILDAASAG